MPPDIVHKKRKRKKSVSSHDGTLLVQDVQQFKNRSSTNNKTTKTKPSGIRKSNGKEKVNESSQALTVYRPGIISSPQIDQDVSDIEAQEDNNEIDDYESDYSSSASSWPSFASEIKTNKESETEEIKLNWEHCVDFFLTDKKKRRGGWGKFPYHLIVYLFFRNESYEKGKFNPTKGQTFNLNDGTRPLPRFTIFCRSVLKITTSQHNEAFKKGDVFAFKRAMIHKRVNQKTIQICDEFIKLRKRLDITGFGRQST